MPPADTTFDHAAALEACARGDVDALQALYRHESRWLLGVALRIVRDRDAAHDVLQEAFVQIWQRAGTYQRALGSARGWIYTVVRHKALDECRRAAREVPVGDVLDELAERADHGAFGALASQPHAEAQALGRCLDALEPRNRDCVVSAFVEGYTHEQIAARMAAPLGSVKSWIRRGLLALRECMA